MSLTSPTMTGVPLEVMLRFNRLKALSNDEAVVAAALRKSVSGLMEVTNAMQLLAFSLQITDTLALHIAANHWLQFSFLSSVLLYEHIWPI